MEQYDGTTSINEAIAELYSLSKKSNNSIDRLMAEGRVHIKKNSKKILSSKDKLKIYHFHKNKLATLHRTAPTPTQQDSASVPDDTTFMEINLPLAKSENLNIPEKELPKPVITIPVAEVKTEKRTAYNAQGKSVTTEISVNRVTTERVTFYPVAGGERKYLALEPAFVKALDIIAGGKALRADWLKKVLAGDPDHAAAIVRNTIVNTLLTKWGSIHETEYKPR